MYHITLKLLVAELTGNYELCSYLIFLNRAMQQLVAVPYNRPRH